MKIFILYAILQDGTRDLLWVRELPADFDWNKWAETRQSAMKLLGIQRFVVEEI